MENKAVWQLTNTTSLSGVHLKQNLEQTHIPKKVINVEQFKIDVKVGYFALRRRSHDFLTAGIL